MSDAQEIAKLVEGKADEMVAFVKSQYSHFPDYAKYIMYGAVTDRMAMETAKLKVAYDEVKVGKP